MSSPPRMKLVYLGVRGLGEPLRMMARYTNYSFAEDVTIPGPEFRVMKMNEKAVHSRSEQLPSLHVASDTVSAAPLVISQSGACMRYLAGITGHTPVSLEQRARADAVFDTAQELFAVNPLANVFPVGAERDAKEKEYFSMAFRRRLRFCERLLDEAKAETGATTAFFGGREPYYGTVCVCVFLVRVVLRIGHVIIIEMKTKQYEREICVHYTRQGKAITRALYVCMLCVHVCVCAGDFQLFHMLDLSLTISPKCLDKAPSVKAFMEEMYALPAVSAYLKERPQQGTQSIGYEGSRMYDGV